jgi:alpha-beta hydrolase superfamily lysophospholipase
VLEALLAPVVRELIYPRHGTRVATEAATYSLDVDDARLRGWVVNPGRARALVYFGGNGERLDPWQDVLAARFPDHTSYLIAYRGYGASEGRPNQRALSSDAVALVDHVTARHPGGRVDVLGRSLGSAVAVHVATRRPVAHVVLVTPFDSLHATAADLFPGLPAALLIRDRWDSATIASGVEAPVLVLRAGRDAVVGRDRTAALVDSLPAPAVVAFPDADHESISEEPAYWTSIARFLDDRPVVGARD